MRYRLLGPSGLRVSELCLGTMTFGTDWGWGADGSECRRVLAALAEAGGNFVDTANTYTDGSSERIVGELTRGDRERWVLATKYTLTLDPADPNAGGNHRKSLVRSLEQSLRRLGTDYVDLLWLHMRDATTPIEESVPALDDQLRLGERDRVAARARRARARADRRRAQRGAARGRSRRARRRADGGAARAARRRGRPGARLPPLLSRVGRHTPSDLRRDVGAAVLAPCACWRRGACPVKRGRSSERSRSAHSSRRTTTSRR